MWILFILWDDGGRERHAYRSREEAEKIEAGFLTAFGKQIVFSFIYFKNEVLL